MISISLLDAARNDIATRVERLNDLALRERGPERRAVTPKRIFTAVTWG